jgi:hypothetical protein
MALERLELTITPPTALMVAAVMAGMVKSRHPVVPSRVALKSVRVTPPEVIGVEKDAVLPSLRTVRAVFPHTALQSVVSSSGLAR